MSHSSTALTAVLLESNPSSSLPQIAITKNGIIVPGVKNCAVIGFSKAFIECILVQYFSESYILQTFDTYFSQFTSGSNTETDGEEKHSHSPTKYLCTH